MVAMGSAEGFSLADVAISSAIKVGSWVLLKNVHLAPSWLHQLEKRVHSMKPHKDFRLFLTMETNLKVPVNLLRLSRILMFEPAPGIKANLQEILGSILVNRGQGGPVEKIRLYFLLAWLHAVVLERLRYAPLGWTKSYEFNDADQEMSLQIIDNWLDATSYGRSNISPDKIPWDAIKTLIGKTVYGGKVDSIYDQKLLDSFVDVLFTPKSFELGFKLVDECLDGTAVTIPEGVKLDYMLEWVNKLPEQQPPSWLGLPNNAEKLLMMSKGTIASCLPLHVI
jgi:dynein heavy chain 1